MIKIRNLIYSKQGNLLSIWRYLRLIIIIFIIKVFIEKLFKLTNIPLPFNDLITKPITIFSVILVSIFIEREKIESLGIVLKFKSFAWIIMGVFWAYFCVIQIEIIGIFISNSDFHLVNPFSKSVILSLGYFLLIVSFPEELIYRGYLISRIKWDTTPMIALLASFILFTAIHLISGAWTNIYNGILFGFTFTILTGLTFLMTKNIFLAIGFHAAWDTFHQLFDSERIGFYIILIVFLVNIIGFYLLYKRLTNFDYKTLLNTSHNK